MKWIRKPQEASHDPASPYTRYLSAGHAVPSYPTHGNDTTNNGTTKENNMPNHAFTYELDQALRSCKFEYGMYLKIVPPTSNFTILEQWSSMMVIV